MRRGSIFWGVLLVLVGAALLADNMGLLPPNINFWNLFWPAILILLGVGSLMSIFRRGAPAETQTLSIPLEEIKTAQVRLHHGAGELHLDGNAGPGVFLKGTFVGGVVKELRQHDDDVRLDLRVPEGSFMGGWPWFHMDRANLNWRVSLNPTVELNLELETGASRSVIDLTGLLLKELRLSTGASSTDLVFPANAGASRAWVRSGAAEVNAQVPLNVAARVRVRGALASVNVNTQRFPRVGDSYQSPDFDSATNRLDLEVETGVGSVNVR